MSMKQLIAALVVVALVVPCASMLVYQESEATSQDTEISNVGFVMEKNTLFYFTKFAVSGFTYTGGSASKDTPTSNIGAQMKDNSIFASINKMDRSSQYYITISEYSGDVLNYGLKIKLEENKVTTFVYMSVIDAVAYSDGVALSATVLDGVKNTSFTQDDFSSIEYRFSLTVGDDDGVISEKIVRNPDKYTHVSVAQVRTVGIEDEVANLGKNYGFLTEKVNDYYAGTVISKEAGDYYCIFFTSNIDISDIQVKIINGKEYTVPTDSISIGNSTSKGTHYYYSIIPTEVLESAGLDADYSVSKVTVGTGDAVYGEYSVSSETGDKDGNNNVVIISVAVVLIIAVLIIAVIKSRGA